MNAKAVLPHAVVITANFHLIDSLSFEDFNQPRPEVLWPRSRQGTQDFIRMESCREAFPPEGWVPLKCAHKNSTTNCCVVAVAPRVAELRKFTTTNDSWSLLEATDVAHEQPAGFWRIPDRAGFPCLLRAQYLLARRFAKLKTSGGFSCLKETRHTCHQPQGSFREVRGPECPSGGGGRQ